MEKFVDETFVQIKAGDGGAGCVSFRHIKFNENGGPDGGHGGKGGDIIFQASSKVINLNHVHRARKYHAENGRPGGGRKRAGRKGKFLTIPVPFGCQIFDAETNKLLHDFDDTKPFLAAEGAKGGKGNSFFATSTNQAPRHAQPGEKTEKIRFKLALKLIADIGLVGFPNAGKSTLLKKLTHATPKIGDYPFTTLIPNLGVMELSVSENVLIADIPGIIEGASRGHGLGLSFLKHIERVKVLLYVLDLLTATPEDELKILKQELETYDPELLKRPSVVAFNKIDLVDDDQEFIKEWIHSFQEHGIKPIAISAKTGEGIEELKKKIGELLKKNSYLTGS